MTMEETRKIDELMAWFRIARIRPTAPDVNCSRQVGCCH